MTGLKVAPALHNPMGNNPYSPPLIADARNQRGSDSSAEAKATVKQGNVNSAPWNGNYAHIQAQLMGAAMQGGYRRPVASSPREAARAYSQTRRRPQTVAAMPNLRNTA